MIKVKKMGLPAAVVESIWQPRASIKEAPNVPCLSQALKKTVSFAGPAIQG